MTSRLPSVWPAYLDNNLYYFNDDDLKDREWLYTSNYGMIPMNIIVSPTPHSSHTYNEYSVVDGCHCYSESGSEYDKLCNFVLSFENLSKWYHFFNEYYNLLKRYGHCNRVYTSAEDYYNYESPTKYANQMKYGSDRQTYIDLDKEFAEKGGRVEVLIFNKDTSKYTPMTPQDAHDETRDDRMAMIDVYDVGFFKWINENIVPSFVIPMKYKNYWKRDVLFYPDVIKWLAWLGERLGYETSANYEDGKDKDLKGDIDTWDCKNDAVADCCDCEEYFNRGGKRIYDEMKSWYDKVNDKIDTNRAIIDGNTNCFIPTMILPTELQTSIDDLGEKSIFSTEFELGVDYRVADGLTATKNTKGGTVVSMNGKSMILNQNSLGYTFDNVYMEKYASKCNDCEYEGVFSSVCPKCGSKNITVMDWSEYIETYISNNRDEFFVTNATYFSYDEEDKKYMTDKIDLDSAKRDLEWKMSKKYPIVKRDNGWVLVEGLLIEVNEAEYATYDKENKYLGNKKYMVFRDDITNTPYTYINGKQIYAEFYAPTLEFYFPFFKKESAEPSNVTCSGNTFNIKDYITFERNELNDTVKYIDYNDNMFNIDESSPTLEIDGKEYYRVLSYATNDTNDNIYQTYDMEFRSGDTMVSLDNVEIDNSYMRVSYPLEVKLYSVKEINGSTVSKLADLRLYNVLVDDIGNDIDGIYEINKETIKNHQPPEGTKLELLYQVGNTANISRFSRTIDDLDDVQNNRNFFVGDIIESMEFYYKEYDGNIPHETVRRVVLEGDDKIHFYKKNENGGYEQYKVIDSIYTSLDAIIESTQEKEALENDETRAYVFYDDVFCDVTYYVGATLIRRNLDGVKSRFNLSNVEYINNHGVQYKETVNFVKENREYYLSKRKRIPTILPSERNEVKVHSISYPIYVYKLSQILEQVNDSDYGTVYEVPMADFRFDISLFSGGTNTFNKYSGDCETYNGLQVFPTFREEYKMGMATMENVDSDIYINRGINAAFERHLKLQEVKTLEALEQFGNSYFKIMEN